MKIGVARELITPAVKTEMGGYGSLYRQHFEGINKRIREAFGDAKARLPCS